MDFDLEGDVTAFDFDSVESIELRFAYDGETMASLDQIEVVQLVPEEIDLLAETDTFAQVSESGAFSFSESLAASSMAETDALLFI